MPAKKLTLYNAYMECSRLWFWMARNPRPDKQDWPGWEKYDEKYGARKSISNCPCCDFKVRSVVNGVRQFTCIDCLPGLWSEEPDNYIPCLRSPSSPYRDGCRDNKKYQLIIARFARDAAREIKEATDD